ncbi:MAG: indole-3-glycerol phosphate synthase [Cyclobacteriaceae bacterium]|jgi:indole-3-glycerol phosphate synthase
MKNILDEIVEYKKTEVANNKALFPIKLLEKSTFFEGAPVSLKKYLRRSDKVGILAEYKRKSPSKGTINNNASIEKTSIGYMQAGASGLSVLTDQNFFGGSNDDLVTARKFNFCPILRKDFIIDEYQIIEAKSIGADVILLIAACLSPDEIKSLSKTAKSLGLEVLLEVHDEEELNRSLVGELDIIGVNNRNLKTFETDIETSKSLVSKIPDEYLKMSESGLSNPKTIVELKKLGYEGFLIGERFMQSSRPDKACGEFIKQIKELL